jgi:predicted amidohydrolase
VISASAIVAISSDEINNGTEFDPPMNSTYAERTPASHSKEEFVLCHAKTHATRTGTAFERRRGVQVRLAVVQPRTFRGREADRNVEAGLRYLDEAVRIGAQIICFPEGYPGPANPRHDYDAMEPLQAKARSNGVFVVASRIEPVAHGPGHHMVLHLIGPEGAILGTYRRTTPLGPYIYKDIDDWQFDYVVGDELPVIETMHGRIGLLVCSEVYAPELARILALKGAELLLAPAGALLNELLPTWRAMVWARAIENLMYTAACQNIYGVEEGVAVIAGPEGVLAESTQPGVLVADLDIDRIRWLRGQDERIEMPKQYRVVPGTLRWPRADLFRKNLASW